VKKGLLSVGLLLSLTSVGRGIIRADFTPKHLTEQADVIFAGTLKATGKDAEWRLTGAEAIKGKAPAEHVLRLLGCPKLGVNAVVEVFKQHVNEPVIVYVGTLDRVKRAYVHLGGRWLSAQPAAKGRWNVTCLVPRMNGTYAGGTDMLIRMSAYLVKDPDAGVPVAAGVRWSQEHIAVGKTAGASGGMAAVEIGKPASVHLFVSSTAGDRLFRPREADDETKFQDVTAAAGVDTRSRRFTWVDVDRDGLGDLISWDGKTVSVRLVGRDGKFKAPRGEWSVKLDDGCTGLSGCSLDGTPGALVSTHAGAVLLMADGKTGWKKVALPPGKGQEYLGQLSGCAVADLDNDGFVDVLQPGEQGGMLWKGKAGGVKAAVKTNVGAGAGIARPVLGDFNEDGALDIFLAGPETNSLWENDGKGGFRNVADYSGSVGCKCPARAAEARRMDLNHDGRQDLCLVYPDGGLMYHFNRGFRAFGEEGKVRLPGLGGARGGRRTGLRATASADFNEDEAQDLIVMLTSGEIYAYLNNQYDKPGLRLRLGPGVTGPVTVSCWQGEAHPVCCGSVPVTGHSPPAYVCARHPGKCTVKWRVPGKGEQRRAVTVGDGVVDVVIGAEAGKKQK